MNRGTSITLHPAQAAAILTNLFLAQAEGKSVFLNLDTGKIEPEGVNLKRLAVSLFPGMPSDQMRDVEDIAQLFIDKRVKSTVEVSR